ncbi:unnamed protein product [Rotaria sordida]|uniref:FLYWCH-type domain-containing protein n=1 Tax=Rotaria sordida TaxID=392033 RepID=A0A815RVB5_9BILA|nr:unnamed protein product [Rotaria sordida]CAF1483310.1 unnamed protein product [Rotaria sordida]CAF4000139.1 unnamed protein product [Rotaria sordida]CAF4050797.1 unnamed protein product [Rotaria sordida]
MTDSTSISFTTSNRGKPLLIYSGYIFRLKKSTVKVKYWTCHSDGCVANVHTDKNDRFIKSNGQHHHIPEPEQIELRNLKRKAKERVKTETSSISKIYEEELARSNLSSTALTLASTAAAEGKSGLNRVRRKTTPPIPTSAEFDIPEFYSQTLDGTQFSLYKNVQSLGLSTSYLEDEDTRLACRSTMALALVPLEYVEEAYELLKNDSPKALAEFFTYYEKQWLKPWHNRFNNRVEKHHPNMWHFLECLKREELLFRQQLGKLNAGIPKKTSSNVCISQKQIDTLTERYEQEQITLIDFLYGLSTLVAKRSTKSL